MALKRFLVHVIPEHPSQGDRGAVYAVRAGDRRDAIRRARAAHQRNPEYIRRPSGGYHQIGGSGRLVFSPLEDFG